MTMKDIFICRWWWDRDSISYDGEHKLLSESYGSLQPTEQASEASEPDGANGAEQDKEETEKSPGRGKEIWE